MNDHSGFKALTEINMNQKRVKDLPAPAADNDAVRRDYLENKYGYQFFRWTPINIAAAGGTVTKDFELADASESFTVEVICEGLFNNNSTTRNVNKWVATGHLRADVLEAGGYEVANIYEIGTAAYKGNIAFSVVAVGSNNRIRITITNNHATQLLGFTGVGIKLMGMRWYPIIEV